jgi:hypothetical protein
LLLLDPSAASEKKRSHWAEPAVVKPANKPIHAKFLSFMVWFGFGETRQN